VPCTSTTPSTASVYWQFRSPSINGGVPIGYFFCIGGGSACATGSFQVFSAGQYMSDTGTYVSEQMYEDRNYGYEGTQAVVAPSALRNGAFMTGSSRVIWSLTSPPSPVSNVTQGQGFAYWPFSANNDFAVNYVGY